MKLDSAISRLYDLNVGIIGVGGDRHERPHKPLLLLAVLNLLDEGKATPDRIPWCQALRDRFTARFLLVRRHDDQNNPDLPFRYLAGDGFWQVFEGDGNTPINREIRVADFGRVFARFTDGFEFLMAVSAIVERIVADIDGIVRQVRFPGWQGTSGERVVQQALRRALLKYKLHTDQELFEKAYGYIRQYY